MDLQKYNKQYAVGVESTSMDYTLNINRALKKKLKATQRNRTLEYKYKKASTDKYSVSIKKIANNFFANKLTLLPLEQCLNNCATNIDKLKPIKKASTSPVWVPTVNSAKLLKPLSAKYLKDV